MFLSPGLGDGVIGYALNPKHPPLLITKNGCEEVLPFLCGGPVVPAGTRFDLRLGPCTVNFVEAVLPGGVMLLAGQHRDNMVALLADGRVVDVKG